MNHEKALQEEADTRQLEAARKLLGEPVYLAFDDNALKVRRNLFTFSSITLYLAYTGVHVGDQTTVLGIQLTGLTEVNFFFALLLLNAYHFVHFLWYSIEAATEWRLRLTGIKSLSKRNTFTNDSLDHPSDPRQSTFHNWWMERANKIKDVFNYIDGRIIHNNRMRDAFNAGITDGIPRWFDKEQYEEIDHLNNSLSESWKQLSDVINDPRVLISLTRFNKWHIFFWKSQSWRWLLIEFLLPFLLGIAAIHESIIKYHSGFYAEVYDWLVNLLRMFKLC